MKLTQCERCIFRFADQLTCVAFPKGVPAEIIHGRFDHRQPFEGDGGIRFVPSRQYARQPDDPEGLSHLGFGK
jgi:hypothetical protein